MMTLRVLVAAMACFTAATAQDTTESQIFVCSPDGSPDTEPYTIAGALALAMPGDTLQLEDGVYPEPIVTVRDGMEGSPITITGGPGAIINGYTGNRLLMWDQKVADIRNSWTTLNVRFIWLCGCVCYYIVLVWTYYVLRVNMFRLNRRCSVEERRTAVLHIPCVYLKIFAFHLRVA